MRGPSYVGVEARPAGEAPGGLDVVIVLFYGQCFIKVSVRTVTSDVSDSATPWTVTRQAPLSVGFFKQEYWSE